MRPNDDPLADAETSPFPLALTPFERYYDLDDSDEYPTTFPVQLEFSGRLDRQRFAAALSAAVARHPLVRALIDDRAGGPAWVADPRGSAQLDWADAPAPIAHPGGDRIDLRTGPGLRTFVRFAPGAARVVFQFHHACCDGLAALEFVRDVLALYKAAAEGDCRAAPLRKLDAALLARRGELAGEHDGKPTLRVACRDVYYALRTWSGILLRTPDALAPAGPAPPGAAPAEVCAFEHASLDRDETARLWTIAASLETTVNDLLLRDLLLVLADWNRSHDAAHWRRLRVNVPVNVRRREEANMPLANRLGFGFVTVERGDTDDPDRLLDVVRGETRRLKEWKLGLYFLGGLAFASRMPRLLRWGLRRRHAFATAVLSNVGRFAPERSLPRDERWRCGPLVLERITGVPPLRPLTRAAMIVAEYAGETTFCLRCDPRLFGDAGTRALLEAFVARVRATLARGH